MAWLCCAVLATAAPDQHIVPHPPSTLLTPGVPSSLSKCTWPWPWLDLRLSVFDALSVCSVGATSLPLKLTTAKPTTCKWGLVDSPYSALPHTFAAGAGSTTHSATIEGLSGTLTLTAVHVRCAAYASEPLTLVYRSLPDTKATTFPRLGKTFLSPMRQCC
jgi:hypothetical protein